MYRFLNMLSCSYLYLIIPHDIHTQTLSIMKCLQVTTTTSSSDDPKQNLNQVVNSIQKTLGTIHRLYLTVSSFNVSSQLPLIQRLKKSNKVPIIAGAVGGVGLFFLVIALGLYYLIWKKSKRTKEGIQYIQQSYKVSEAFPFKWINKKWRKGFHVTAMATAGSKWAIVMSCGAGFSDQVFIEDGMVDIG
ncbi:unnamed protein product [Lactuca saligna]|uniref:DUF7477 domain-containing protein n=1 Tax=Lactuca saligna TaxID=75948 RepID=A0AA35Y7R7_LACSI|nr:unnamed protein product [Lactuca saligna]